MVAGNLRCKDNDDATAPGAFGGLRGPFFECRELASLLSERIEPIRCISDHSGGITSTFRSEPLMGHRSGPFRPPLGFINKGA